jgi:hypothetical protein
MVERGLSVYLLVLQGCVGEEELAADEEGKEEDEMIKDNCLCMPKGVGRAMDWVVGIREDRGIKVEWQG